jgi:hypothetical protein
MEGRSPNLQLSANSFLTTYYRDQKNAKIFNSMSERHTISYRKAAIYKYTRKHSPPKKIAKFDMMKPEERQAFVDVWRLIPDRYPPPQTSARPRCKDLLRVQRLHDGGHQRRNVETRVVGRRSTLRESSSFSLAAPTRQVTHEAANGGSRVPD